MNWGVDTLQLTVSAIQWLQVGGVGVRAEYGLSVRPHRPAPPNMVTSSFQKQDGTGLNAKLAASKTSVHKPVVEVMVGCHWVLIQDTLRSK